jgi:hypothetical protein
LGQWSPKLNPGENMRRNYIYILSVIILLMSSCSPPSGEVAPVPSTPVIELSPTDIPMATQAESSSAYPLPERYTVPTPSYPLPPTEVPHYISTPFTIPTPGDETGVVIGRLVNIDTNEYLSGQSVYLGQKIFHTPGPSYTLGVQEMSSPHTISDPEGRFAIGDIEPGVYVVMIWTPFTSYIVTDENTNMELEVTVNPSETLDLGILMAKNPLMDP